MCLFASDKHSYLQCTWLGITHYENLNSQTNKNWSQQTKAYIKTLIIP